MREFSRAKSRLLSASEPSMASDNGGGSANQTLATVAQKMLDEHQRELQQIAERLCALLPVGGIFTFAVQVVSPLTAPDGSKRLLANEVVQITRPAVCMGKQFVVTAGKDS